MVRETVSDLSARSISSVRDLYPAPAPLTQADLPKLQRTRFLQFDELTSPIIRKATCYWMSKQEDGLPMRRRDFDAMEIPHLLPHLVFLEVLRDDAKRVCDFRYRVIGDVLMRYSCGNYTGKCLTEVDGQGPGSEVWAVLSAIAEQGKPVLSRPPYVGPHRQIFFCEACSLPMIDDTGAVDRLLIVCDFLPTQCSRTTTLITHAR